MPKKKYSEKGSNFFPKKRRWEQLKDWNKDGHYNYIRKIKHKTLLSNEKRYQTLSFLCRKIYNINWQVHI